MDMQKFMQENVNKFHAWENAEFMLAYRKAIALEGIQKGITDKSIEEIISNSFLFRNIWLKQIDDWYFSQFPDLFDIFGIYDDRSYQDICEITKRNYKNYLDRLHNTLFADKRKAKPYKFETNQLRQFRPSERFSIFERDGFKCVICGRSASDGVKLHADHIYPKAKGGIAVIDNGVTLCNECNIGKSDRIPSQEYIEISGGRHG